MKEKGYDIDMEILRDMSIDESFTDDNSESKKSSSSSEEKVALQFNKMGEIVNAIGPSKSLVKRKKKVTFASSDFSISSSSQKDQDEYDEALRRGINAGKKLAE